MSNEIVIDNSVSGHKWKLRDYDERQVKAIMQRFGLSEIVARLLSARGVEVEAAEGFLNPSLKNLLPDPLHYLDMEAAADRLARAVIDGEKIAVFGDYDVDGATSSSLLKRFFTALGAEAIVHIPDRIEEGYGPNRPAIQKLWDRGAKILITVDCGTVSYEPLAAAKEIGFDTIVVDHHMGGETLPESFAVINPNRMDETTTHKYMAAVGVSFMLAVAVSTRLRELGYFKTNKEPNLLNLLDLVALGTICDVMPLIGVNRAFVAQGLKIMAGRRNVGLAALADIANLSEAPGVFHLGFLLGPRINAGGRVGEAGLGVKLLTTNSPTEAREIAETLNKLNEERRALEFQVEEEATKIVEEEGVDVPLIMPIGYGWHQGVVGIVASRLKERYHRPTAVVTINDGIAKASGRSITGVDLGAAVASARDLGLTLTGGGHAMAAGFTAEEAKLPELKKFFYERLQEQVEQNSGKVLNIDAVISVNAVNARLAESLEKAGPYGTGNSEPRFMLKDARLVNCTEIGNGHLKCIFDDATSGKFKVYAMAFRAMEKPLGQFLLSSVMKEMSVAIRMRLSSWQGRERVDVQIDDVAA
ncbi:MAG: single-stranded-DNA-specific exonuclease RecJ [Alphaproteobacteria bacterium CG11_big_fil_rev_8_21_14_0_20_44_7]|nr:MAG: single-stranded-DNA-specific exonuclease RecJ [Alphaproteobacteria bacterium CG11_big_fil_rev_8_21_14_0_20_44_7]